MCGHGSEEIGILEDLIIQGRCEIEDSKRENAGLELWELYGCATSTFPSSTPGAAKQFPRGCCGEEMPRWSGNLGKSWLGKSGQG